MWPVNLPKIMFYPLTFKSARVNIVIAFEFIAKSRFFVVKLRCRYTMEKLQLNAKE